MMIRLKSMTMLGIVASTLFVAINAYGVSDNTNQGRWAKPTENNLPDKEVPGFLVNLGPTGARAVLTEKSFIVRYLFKNSPAVGLLKLEDEIVGVFGKPFSPHHFGGGPHGYEGPIMDFGEAIERAEGKDGKLVLNVTRESKMIEVIIPLEAIGSFSATYPFNCKKSEIVRAKALKYFVEQPDVMKVWQSHAHAAVTLALLTSDDAKQRDLGLAMVLKWGKEKPDSGTGIWNLSYQLITLSEYHLLTKDASVLPTMKLLTQALEKGQYSGRILVWGPSGDKALEKVDYAKVDAAQQLYDGGFGHGPYRPGASPPTGGFGINGYGPMQYTTILAVTAWQLAGRCGVDVNPDCIKRAMAFIHRGTNAAGYVAYGGEFTLNAGPADPVAFKKSKGGDNYVGRAGAAIIAEKLSPELADSTEYIDLNKGYLKHAYKSLPDGHADSNLGIFWGILGAAASEDEAALRKVLDYHKAFFNMMRCHDGSFVLLPGRDYADNGYYMASRYHPTGTLILVLGLSNPKLLIQGIQVSIPYVNPKALKGKLDSAYKAIVKKSYGEAAGILKNAKGESAEQVEAMLAYLDTQAQADVVILEALEKSGDIYQLDRELVKMRTKFGPLESFKTKVVHFEEELRKDPWKLEIKRAINYYQLVEALKRNNNISYANDLDKFAVKYPDSFYGKRAQALAAEFRDSLPKTASSGSKPAPIAPVKAAAISRIALEAWQARLVKKLDSLTKSGAKIMFTSDSSDGKQSQRVISADDKALTISVQGNQLPVPWKIISNGSRATLAKGAVKDEDVEALLIAAVFFLANGDASDAEDMFARASAKDANAVKAAKAGLLTSGN